MKANALLILLVLFLSTFYCYANQSPGIPPLIKENIERDFPGARIAQKKDFGNYLEKLKGEYNVDIESLYNTSIVYDITGDSKIDYTLIVINSKERFFSFVTYISNDNYSSPHKLSMSRWPTNHDGTIWQLMWLKPAGEYGMSKEKYFNAPGKEYPYTREHTETDILEYNKAVERYKNMPTIEKSDARYGAFDADDLLYCKTAYYFENNSLKSISKCD